MDKLNIGCGKDLRKDFINLDSHNDDGADVCFDLNDIYKGNKLPFKDNQFEEILMYDVLEYIPYPLPILKEIHRVCKIDGLIKIKVPYGDFTWGNPDHKRVFFVGTFNMYNFDSYYYYKESCKNIELVKQKLFINPTKSIIKKIKYGLFLPIINQLIKISPAYLDLTILRFLFQGMNILVVIKKTGDTEFINKANLEGKDDK